MNLPRMQLAEIASALQERENRFRELDMFVDDVEEIVMLGRGELPKGLRPLDPRGARFAFVHEGDEFTLEMTEGGVARIRRQPPGSSGPSTPIGTETMRRFACTAIESANVKKGSPWVAELFLGMFTDSLADTPDGPHFVLTIAFNPRTREWQVYVGGLLLWMKSEFIAAAEGSSA